MGGERERGRQSERSSKGEIRQLFGVIIAIIQLLHIYYRFISKIVFHSLRLLIDNW